MEQTIDTIRGQLQDAGRYMIEKTLTWGNAGNISARTTTDNYLITASGTRLDELGDDDFVECSIPADPGRIYPRRPSKETPMHQAIYENRPDVNAVIHAAPLYSTLIACSNVDIPSNLFVETMYYLERIARVPYHHPGSQSLGDAVRELAISANILLLNNHGVLVFDTTLNEAMMGLQVLETACQTLVLARNAGITLNTLSPDVVQDFLDNSGYKPRRKWK
jgi:3-dehydro-4-phosphotetronate decarboxylase